MDNIRKDEEVSKLRSFSVLNTFYHEMQQEMVNLDKRLACKDGIIADLNARLARYERTCFNDEDAAVMVGPSKSLVDSLFKEIFRLKQRLKETEMDSKQKLENSKRETECLQQKLREKDQELECVLQRPEHQKEQEIRRLYASLAERDRVQATKDVLCSSLVEELDQLRGQLGTTVKVCQELLGRVDKNRAPSDEHKTHSSEMTGFSDVAHLNDLVSNLQMENEHLKQRVTYVENLNSKWQRYDQSRELYVKGLCQKLKDSGALQEEIGRLNNLLEEKMEECERTSTERDDRAQRDQEHIQMLEQQVLAYVEDFKSERADRERAQTRILELQDNVERLQLQIHTQNTREAPSTRRLNIDLKKPGRKQAASAEPLLRSSPPDSNA
ncbi:TNFAIP3-interacting protein 2 [Brachyhypopomus gauderio]|uniref:TNFAIP3-interacting protein 2 n=1 Tax=Brachyhypopomus gauderio TaxID=698409 RepID=UPI0040420E90